MACQSAGLRKEMIVEMGHRVHVLNDNPPASVRR